MKIFGITILFPGRKIDIMEMPTMSEPEIARALAQAHDKHPVWCAFLQLLKAFEEAERLNIGTGLERSDRHVFWSAGGADTLAKFRDDLIRRRDLARRGLLSEDASEPDIFHRERPRGFIPETERDGAGHTGA